METTGALTVIDCGCRVVEMGDGTVDVRYCAMHTAAPALLAACEEAIESLTGSVPREWRIHDILATAVAKAEGRS